MVMNRLAFPRQFLILEVLPLDLDGRPALEVTMPPFRAVEQFYVIEDISPYLVTGGVSRMTQRQ